MLLAQYESARTASLPLLSRITLKRVEHSERMSQETNCYACDVWLDGKKVADARNDGTGGETIVHWLIPQAVAEFRIELAAAQGAEPASVLMFSFTDAVDYLLHQWVEDRLIKQIIRRYHKKGRHVILCGDTVFSAPAERMSIVPQVGDKVQGRVVTAVHLCGGAK